jgi:predicted phage terminase large subunit-like protein
MQLTRAECHDFYCQARNPADLKALALADLFFLLRHLLNRPDIEHPWLYERCREVAAAPDGRLDLWARGHYKSTIITFALTIQDLLNNPELTVGIFSHTRPIAKSFLRQIMRELENNQLLKDLFPEVLWDNPRRQAPKWSEDDGVILKRAGNPKEASLEAWGLVDGQPTGRHYALRVYDDVVTRESVTTPEMIAKVTEAWELSLNLGAAGGRARYIGTRYHAADAYQVIMERGAAIPRLHPATVDGSPGGAPVLLSREALAEKRRAMGPYVFGSQMLQNPLADAVQGFREEWLRFYGEGAPGNWREMNRYLLVDPASEKKPGSDYTVIWVLGLAPDHNYYLLDGIRDRLNLTERGERLLALHKKWRPISVGYEKYGQQADIEHILYVQNQRNYRFPIMPLGGAMPKNDRIRRLIPLFEQARVWLPHKLRFIDYERRERDMVHEFIRQEYLHFPVAGHDDMLDALARIADPDLGAVFPLAPAEAGVIAAQDSYNPLEY